MKVKFWVHIHNMGDGSAVAKFFNSKEAAEAFAEGDDERFCEDVEPKELEFDEQGNLLTPNPKHWNE